MTANEEINKSIDSDIKSLLPKGDMLNGMRVLDLSRALSGPFCTMTLGDLGADIWKVEPAGEGDLARSWGPFDRGQSVYYLSTNRNKRGICIDFRNPEAINVLREIALSCDVIVENFKPGTLDKMGFERIEFRADNNNKRSNAAMQKIGCTVEGILRNHLPLPNGTRRDSIVLSILKEEWTAKLKQNLQAQLK